MRAVKTGTVRFAKVSDECGEPVTVSLWTEPERDKSFMTAVRQNRVMSIKQETAGSAKDFGVVGFLREKNVSYLVFPKSLEAFKDRRIVGIKYDLIHTPGPVGTVIRPQKLPKAKRRQKVVPAEWEEANDKAVAGGPGKGKKTFRVTIRFSATAEVKEQVKAASKKEAKEAALTRATVPNLRKGTVTRKVVKVVS